MLINTDFSRENSTDKRLELFIISFDSAMNLLRINSEMEIKDANNVGSTKKEPINHSPKYLIHKKPTASWEPSEAIL